MAKFRYQLHKAQLEKSPVYLSVSFDKVRLRIFVGITVITKHWDQKNQKINPRTTGAKQVNDDLQDKLEAAQSAFRELVIHNKDINKTNARKAIENAIKGNIVETPHDLLSFSNTFIEGLKNKTNHNTNRNFSPSTISTHRQSLNVFTEFAEETRTDLEFESIDLSFHSKFLNWANNQLNHKNEPRFSNNTLGKHIKNLKVWINAANEMGLTKIQTHKRREFTKPKATSLKDVLTDQEIKAITNADLTEQKELDIIRDTFILLYYTGLRYSDILHLTNKNVSGKVIQIKTQKTSTITEIPITSPISDMLVKYEGKFPPKRANAYFNRRIKEIAKLAKLNREYTKYETKGGIQTERKVKLHEIISAHSIRRSFVTNAYKRGIPPASIMMITGHKTEKQLFDYVNLSQEDRLEIMKANMHKLVV